MIPAEVRQQWMLAYEGQALSNAGQSGNELAAEHSRCAIDGLANALIRIEGREETAKFCFALVDRVAGGLRQPTLWTPGMSVSGMAMMATPAPRPATAPVPAVPLQPSSRAEVGGIRGVAFLAWVAGFAAGLAIGRHWR